MSEESVPKEKFTLSFQEVESILDGVLNNQKLQKIDTSKAPRFIVFCHPTGHEILTSRYIRDKALEEAKADGLPSIADMDKQLADRGLLGDDSSKLENLEKQVEGQRAILEKTQIPGRRSALQEVIARIENEMREIRYKRESYYYLTQERKADEESYLYLAWACTHALTGGKYWKTFDDFENETDLDFRNEVLLKFADFNKGLITKIVRYVARHSLWRIRFVAAKNTGAGSSLFDRGFNDLTPDQLGLLYWSNYYQSIYEMLPDEQPPPEIIEDDEQLDKYMEEYFKDKEAERKEGKARKRSDRSQQAGPKGYQQKLNAWKTGDELIITPAHPDYTSLAYSRQRVKAAEGVSEVEVVAPNSRRARNRRARAKSQTSMRGRSR